MLRPLLYLCVLMALAGAASALICTMTGPTIIDFRGQLNNVTDRCAYTLVSNSDLEVFANFLERRRRDVSFVDSITLTLLSSGDTFELQQGGEVLVNGAVESINSSEQQFHGVNISKSDIGITAHFTNFSVFFDGTTAQIYTQGSNSPWTGLCVDSSNVPAERNSGNSPSSCDVLYTDDPDTSINCTMATERCNILTKHTFASCNADVDPAPYIDACRETMCRYPAQDALMTQFLWAYARACSLSGHNELGDWWTEAECSPPKAYCQGIFCKDHEFCGWKFSGEPACLCRAVFAQKYKQANTLGDPTICNHNSASVTLYKCLLEERDIDYKVLHLNDPTCSGELNNVTNTVTFSFSTKNLCGAEILYEENTINYTNTIINQNSTSIIVRQDQVFIEFSCYRPQPEMKSVSFRIQDSSYVEITTSGEWTYNVSMIPYIDETCSRAVATETDVKLDQKVWVELKTEGLDEETIAVVTESCWATSGPSPGSMLRYELIIDGCANPLDGTVQVKGNGVGTFNRFSFNMFEFRSQPKNVYLHCLLQLCLTKNNCVPVCPPNKRRRRFARSKYDQGAPAVLSMGWKK